MTIDANTGLPELPEGYFWRVSHPQQLVIMKHLKGTEWSDWDESNRAPWGMRFTEEESRTKPGIFNWLKRVSEYRWRYRDSDLAVQQAFYADDKEAADDNSHYDPSEFGVITPENIVPRAEALLARYQQRLASEELIGDYPPKRLGGA